MFYQEKGTILMDLYLDISKMEFEMKKVANNLPHPTTPLVIKFYYFA